MPTEHAKQAFVNRDKEKTGSIPALEFVDLIRKIRQHKLSSYVDENLLAVSPTVRVCLAACVCARLRACVCVCVCVCVCDPPRSQHC